MIRVPSRRRVRDDDGIAIVEFALVLPVLVMLLLGMITAGIAWNQQLALSSSARIGARYGATLPLSAHEDLDAWLDAVAVRVLGSDEGQLAPGVAGRYLCVAYVHPAGTTSGDRTRRRLESGAPVTRADTPCFDDGQSSTSRRIQVVAGRDSVLEVGLWRRDLTLRRQVVFGFEAHGGL